MIISASSLKLPQNAIYQLTARVIPDNPVTLVEAVSMINRLLEHRCDSDSITALSEYKTFTDVTPKDWFYYDIIEASNFHEYNNTSGKEV